MLCGEEMCREPEHCSDIRLIPESLFLVRLGYSVLCSPSSAHSRTYMLTPSFSQGVALGTLTHQGKNVQTGSECE